MYGMYAKDTAMALRLGDGTKIKADGEFRGGWDPGSDVGRYTSS